MAFGKLLKLVIFVVLSLILCRPKFKKNYEYIFFCIISYFTINIADEFPLETTRKGLLSLPSNEMTGYT